MKHMIDKIRKSTPAVAAVAILGSMIATTALAQQQAPGQVLRQFGPRMEKPAGGQPSAALSQQQARPQAKVVAKHGDWALTCGPNPQPGEGETAQACAMIQTASSKDQEGVRLTLMLVPGQKDGKPNTMMRVMAPIGVFLPTGVALEIDGAAVGRVPFTRCLPQTCMAFAEASPPTLEKMKKGAKANFIIYEAPGAGLTLEISLKGFTAGLRELHNL